MTNEFKALLKSIFGSVALASLFSYLTFVVPSDDQNQSNELSLNEEIQEKHNNDFDRSGNHSNRIKREVANFTDEVNKKQVNRKDRSQTSIGARVARPSGEARDPAYNSREIEGSSNSGSFFVGSTSQASARPFAPSPDLPESADVKPDFPNNPRPDGDGPGNCLRCITKPEEPLGPSGDSKPKSRTEAPDEFVATKVTCSHDMAEGNYTTAISVTINCSETATIWYCLDTGGSSCTPSIQYTGPINLPTDGNYGISYYAQASASSTDVDDLLYTIDTTAPDLNVSHDVIYAQTTQVPLQNTTTSSDFGIADYYYHQINFKSFNPLTAATPWTCSEVLSDYATASPTPQVIQSNFPTSGLTVADQIIQTNDMPSLVIGDNHIMTVLEDRALGVVSCQVQNIVVRDFAIADFTGTGSTPVTTGVRRTLGSFVGFGHFQAAPNTSSAGQLSNTKGSTSTKQGLYTLTH